MRAIVKATGGLVGAWAGAKIAATGAAIILAPAEAAPGPGTALHGIAIFGAGLVGGGIGYWVGDKTTTYVYELIVE